MQHARHIFFIGIAGVGVSALARAALARGIKVSGSDPHADPTTDPVVAKLAAAGAALYRTHDAANLAPEVDLIVASAAVPPDNPELQEAGRRGIPTVSRAEYLGALMDAHKGVKIAVAGTHGKTTTTAMIGYILQEAGLDPTIFVGGDVPQLGGNVRIGAETGPLVVEACEAYGSFLTLHPDIAIITNIEADHLDYYGTFEKVVAAFQAFSAGVTPITGRVVACQDAGLASLLPAAQNRIDYGIDSPAAASRATDISVAQTTTLTWHYNGISTQITLNQPGRHNILNAFAAATACREAGVAFETIAAALSTFRGVGRRQEILGEIQVPGGAVLVIDDYAHHPTEIAATIGALRAAHPDRRLFLIFQPHLYSRTRDFLQEFAETTSRADLLIVTDIYPAREAPIPGVRADAIVTEARRSRPNLDARYVADQTRVPALLASELRAGDIALFMGAGDIRMQGEALLTRLAERARSAA